MERRASTWIIQNAQNLLKQQQSPLDDSSKKSSSSKTGSSCFSKQMEVKILDDNSELVRSDT
jgi:hypothetical protein